LCPGWRRTCWRGRGLPSRTRSTQRSASSSYLWQGNLYARYWNRST
jgi:hypothetical protein